MNVLAILRLAHKYYECSYLSTYYSNLYFSKRIDILLQLLQEGGLYVTPVNSDDTTCLLLHNLAGTTQTLWHTPEEDCCTLLKLASTTLSMVHPCYQLAASATNEIIARFTAGTLAVTGSAISHYHQKVLAMLPDYVRQNFEDVQGRLLRDVYTRFGLATNSIMGYREFVTEMENLVVTDDCGRVTALKSSVHDVTFDT